MKNQIEFMVEIAYATLGYGDTTIHELQNSLHGKGLQRQGNTLPQSNMLLVWCKGRNDDNPLT